MQVWDYPKALATGALVLALNLATLVAIIFGYSAIDPGHPPEFYSEAAPRVGAYSGPIAGALLMLIFVWLLSSRKPRRNAYAFAATTFASYAALDIALGLAAAPASDLFRMPFVLSLGGVCIAALAAAFLASSRKRNA